MSENEALKYMKLFRDEWDRNSKTKNAEALDVAIKSLEEMQKIKALGDCYIIPKNSTWEVNGIDIHNALEEIQQYRAVGTVERFRFLQEVCDLNGDELENIANSMIELKNYRAIGTIEEFKALKERNVYEVYGK